ncbi:pentapeptide repeat-containing protein [Actinocorallia longicatena]|uniref:Pentapeptide repeat protein n=1 Tax=Actinocorallia longicatena TaxID=111803 RepID=A0ABP6Q633_9ACTN
MSDLSGPAPTTSEVEPRPRARELTQSEIDALPLDKRLELLALERQGAEAAQARRDAERERERARDDARRDRRWQGSHQWINSLVLLFGIVLAFITWRTGQEELRTSRDNLATVQQGQVTERYTKAVEQLGSSRREVRIAAVYALERIARDSDRDRIAIRDVLAAFVREHDPGPKVEDAELPKEPDTDVAAALNVLARRPADPVDHTHGLDLHGIRTPATSFISYEVNLTSANLESANLSRTDLNNARMDGARLNFANLTGADLNHAILTRAYWSPRTCPGPT